jgi:hypothetical protein
VVNLEILFLVWHLEDIIVHPRAVLVLDDSVSFLMVRNFFCYAGARVVQRSGYLNTDVVGTLRGSISPFIKFSEMTGNVVKLNLAELLHDVPTKPWSTHCSYLSGEIVMPTGTVWDLAGKDSDGKPKVADGAGMPKAGDGRAADCSFFGDSQATRGQDGLQAVLAATATAVIPAAQQRACSKPSPPLKAE